MSRVSQNLPGDNNAPAAIADYTIAYTTDDPGITAGDSITIADGDSVTAAENHEAIVDLAAKLNLALAALRSIGAIQT